MNMAIGRYCISTLLFLLLAFLVPLYMCLDLNVSDFDFNIALSWFIVAYVSLQLSIILVRNRERILEMTFWIFSYVFMGIVPFVQLSGKRFPWEGFYEQDVVTNGLLIVFLGIVCYQTGLLLGNRKQGLSSFTERAINISTDGYILASIVLIVLSLALIFNGSGFQALFLPRNDSANTQEIKSIGLLMDQFSKVPLFACLVLGIWMWKKKKFTHVYGNIMVIVLLISNLLISNPISNSRFWFGSVLLTIVMLVIPWSKLGFARWSFGYLGILLFIFPYADLFRDRLNAALKLRKVTDFIMDKGDYDAFQSILNTHKYVDLVGILPGRQLLSTLFFWIPRSIWVNKPYSSGQVIAETLNYKFTNISCPLWAESFVNFGYAGVVVIFILYGYVTSLLQRRYMQSKITPAVTFSQLMVPFFSAFQILFLRGDLQNAVTYLSVYLLFAFLFNLKSQAAGPQLRSRLFVNGMESNSWPTTK